MAVSHVSMIQTTNGFKDATSAVMRSNLLPIDCALKCNIVHYPTDDAPRVQQGVCSFPADWLYHADSVAVWRRSRRQHGNGRAHRMPNNRLAFEH